MWARSYAQFIAARGGEPLLAAQLQTKLDLSAGLALQWDADDFAPVAEAIAALFQRKGWLP